jgi:CRP-like cAMP-binding protein
MDAALQEGGAVVALRALFHAAGEPQEVPRRSRSHRGGPLYHAFLVQSGWFGRSRSGATGAEAFTAVYMTGDVIGLDALADGVFADEVVALTAGTVLRVPLADIQQAVAAGGAVANEVAHALATETRFLREALVAVGTQSSAQRLSTFLIQTHDRLVAMGQIPPGATQWPLPLTQGQLGAVLGLTSVHVNRVLRMLGREGLLDLRGGVVRDFDVEGLRRRAERPG